MRYRIPDRVRRPSHRWLAGALGYYLCFVMTFHFDAWLGILAYICWYVLDKEVVDPQ